MTNYFTHLFKSFFSTVIVLLFFSFSLIAQHRRGENKLISKAARSYSYFKFDRAIEQYRRVLRRDRDNAAAIYGIANCYLQLSDYTKSLEYFEKLRSSWADSGKFMFSYVFTLKANGRYGEAAKNCEDYLLRHPDDSIMKNFAESIIQVKDFYSDSSKWNIGFLNINSKYRDYSPVLHENSLIYVSTRPAIKGRVPTNKFINHRKPTDLAKVYNMTDTGNIQIQATGPGQILKVSTDEELRFMPVVIVDKKKMNVGPVTFSKDGKTTFYTVNNKLIDHTSWLGIMSADYNNGKISRSKPFVYNEKKHSVEHPALSPDGQFLYFSSNKPGGAGGFDLYSCKLDISGKTWMLPKNLGSLINTKGNEMFPVVDSAGNLYFSSDGLAGLGGLDLFYVKMNEGFPMGSPENLGYPVNSSFDDFGIAIAPGGTSGYFSSNRREENDDLYHFNYQRTKNYINIKGAVFDANTKIRISGVRIEMKDTDGKTNKLVSDSAGNFRIQLEKETILNTTAQKPGYRRFEDQLHTDQLIPDHFIALYLQSGLDSSSITIVTDSHPDRALLKEGDQFPDSTLQPTEKKYIVHYQYDSAVVLNADRSVLDTIAAILKQHPEFYVLVTSFTDCRGNVVYNTKLSKRRSAFVKNYLLKKGLNAKNIKTAFFGKKYPVLPCKEDKNFNKQLQQSNRRSEIIITGDKNRRWHPFSTLENKEKGDKSLTKRRRRRLEKQKKTDFDYLNNELPEEINSYNNDKSLSSRLKRKHDEKFSKKRLSLAEKHSRKKAKLSGDHSWQSQNKAINSNAVTDEIANKSIKENTIKEELLFDKISSRINNKPIYLETSSDSVSISLYDNGVFDHDSVSVVYNSMILTNKQLLNVDKAAIFHLKIDEDQKNNKLIFYADNLGDISPNSCLMVVYDGVIRTEIPVTTDLNHNTVVIFMKKKSPKAYGSVRL
jgi:outer membrane protein OmpA-like peptidoglycan-associated protein